MSWPGLLDTSLKICERLRYYLTTQSRASLPHGGLPSKIRPLQKIYAHPPFSLKAIAKGHLLLESTPTKQTEIICSSIHSDEIRSVHVCVG